MKSEEYDDLIKDPTGYLFNIWLPRVSRDIVPPKESATFRHNLALLKGGMAMMQYFDALGGKTSFCERKPERFLLSLES